MAESMARLSAGTPPSGYRVVKVKSTLIWLLEWGFGISLIISASCSSTEEKKPEAEPEFENLNAEEANDFSLEDITEEGGFEENEFKRDHPRDDNSWTLKAMIMTAKRPEDDDMIRCRNEIFALTQDSRNEGSLLTAQKRMVPEFKQNSIRYHWCFYYSMMILDSKLNSDALGLTMKTRLSAFQKEMKNLWILARGLDEAYNTSIYFKYLRKRYLSLSKKYFARPLEIYSPPIGSGARPARKSASEFE